MRGNWCASTTNCRLAPKAGEMNVSKQFVCLLFRLLRLWTVRAANENDPVIMFSASVLSGVSHTLCSIFHTYVLSLQDWPAVPKCKRRLVPSVLESTNRLVVRRTLDQVLSYTVVGWSLLHPASQKKSKFLFAFARAADRRLLTFCCEIPSSWAISR